jgi:A/G-specific adenine glycosylase
MRNFSTLIQNWYLKNGRNLPWRRTNDPYKIWLSEIILQQTRVDQGITYYQKFVQSYPKIEDLAAASEDEVLKNWQGLGYYSRARNLHTAAKTVCNQHFGKFPTTYSEVINLKGVGKYTASAICSIAYGLPYAVVDGNVYRVLSRYLNLDRPIDSSIGQKEFQVAADEILDRDNPSIHNQALMEIGALVCTPNKPDCLNCPLNDECEGYEKGTMLNLPVKEKRIKVRNRYFNYLILHDSDEIIIKKRGPKDIWQALYDFPLMEFKNNSNPTSVQFREKGISSYFLDGEFKHILSHQHIHAKFWVCELESWKMDEIEIKIHKNDLEKYPLPQLLIRYLASSQIFGAD